MGAVPPLPIHMSFPHQAQSWTGRPGQSSASLTALDSACSHFGGAAQLRELMYQMLGLLVAVFPLVPRCPGAAELWAPALVGHLPGMERQHWRLLIRHVLQALAKGIPPDLRCAPLRVSKASCMPWPAAFPQTCSAPLRAYLKHPAGPAKGIAPDLPHPAQGCPSCSTGSTSWTLSSQPS